MSPINRETIVERRQPQLHWGAVFAGAAISVGVWIVLQVWGAGIGLSSIAEDHAINFRHLGIGASIWSLVSPIVAMFIGGWLGGWLAQTRERGVGAAHGIVIWALATLGGLLAAMWMTSMFAAANAGNAANAAGGPPPVDVEHMHMAHNVGVSLIWIGVSMLVALLAAIFGGMLGAQRVGRRPLGPRGESVTVTRTAVEPEPWPPATTATTTTVSDPARVP